MTSLTVEPQIYDHYEIEQIIGRGAMGVVYLARDTRIGRHVALKTLQPRRRRFDDDAAEIEFLARFLREAEVGGSLTHPNIVTLYEVGYDGDRLKYLAMEYVAGQSVLALLSRNSRLELTAAVNIVEQVLRALAYAHARGVIHRDIKPANILITHEGQAKISDFGIARSSKSNLTQAGQILGTPQYIAPEHVIGLPTDPRSDLFSVGVVLYEMLTGRKPFTGTDLADTLYTIVHHQPLRVRELVPDLPEWIELYTQRLLEKTPDARFDSSIDALDKLRHLMVANGIDINFPSPTISFPIQRGTIAEETPTTPLSSSTVRDHVLPKFERHVPRSLAFTAIAVLCGAMVGTMIVIGTKIEESATVTIPPSQLAEFESKKDVLRDAELLFSAGAYEESWRRYDEYLRKYPYSTVATQGRERARIARELAKGSRPASKPPKRITRKPTRPLSPATTASEAEQPTTWQKIRRWFTRK